MYSSDSIVRRLQYLTGSSIDRERYRHLHCAASLDLLRPVPDIHGFDGAVLEPVDVMNNGVLQNLASQITNNLVHFHRNPVVSRDRKAHRLHAWVDHGPLPRPIFTDTAMSMHAPAFHAVGPR